MVQGDLSRAGFGGKLLMFKNIVMWGDCCNNQCMSELLASLRVGILMEDGYKNFDPGIYLNGYSWEKIIMSSPVLPTLENLKANHPFDVFLNLCEGYEKPYYSGMDVVRALEKLNMPFTGAGSRFYQPTREEMQAVAERHEIGFVRGVHVADVSEAEALTEGLRYPLMVKHPNSFGSTGMTRKSRVENLRELKQQVRRIKNRFGSARVEEFIVGREFTVFVVDNPDELNDPFVYPPAELIFPEGERFLHSKVKWKEWVYLKQVVDEQLTTRLKDMTRGLFKAMNGTGYARTDIRMNQAGELFIIEINPNNGILYKPEDLGPADIMMEWDKDGHAGFLDRIFRSAIARQQVRVSL